MGVLVIVGINVGVEMGNLVDVGAACEAILEAGMAVIALAGIHEPKRIAGNINANNNFEIWRRIGLFIRTALSLLCEAASLRIAVLVTSYSNFILFLADNKV